MQHCARREYRGGRFLWPERSSALSGLPSRAAQVDPVDNSGVNRARASIGDSLPEGRKPAGPTGAPCFEREWGALARAMRATSQSPQDRDCRIAGAMSAARLGLRTLARQLLAPLRGGCGNESPLGELVRRIDALPDDRIDPSALDGTLEANVAALARRGVDLGAHIAAWRERLARCEICRARDGNVVRCTESTWSPLADIRGACERDPLPFLGPDGRLDAARPPRGIVVEGIAPPVMLRRIAQATGPMADGFFVRLMVAQHDPIEAFDGLCQEPLADLIEQDRISWFIGPQASDSLSRRLREAVHLSLPTHYVKSPGLRAAAAPPVIGQIESARAAQEAEHARLVAATTSAYSGRGPAAWAERFGRSIAEPGPAPLRILIPVSRFSTFVRHSASDLAEALRAMGHEARVLCEPDEHSRLASVAYLRLVDQWRPDLVILINYTRHHVGRAVPPGVPFVCWIQDRMPHLFDDAAGAAQGALDFLTGHIHPDLLLKHGYPRERSLPWFVPASGTKFHAALAPEELRRRFECDVAYASHQSEPPRAVHERLAGAFAAQPRLRAAIESLFEQLERAARDPQETDATPRSLTVEALREAGFTSEQTDPRLFDAVSSAYAVPITERLHRHITLQWAASIADRRGWRLGLFGRGWESHPTLSRFARGPVEHDEGLRALYQAARCHLHISQNTNAHQRVYECALSGGLMLRRGPSPDSFSIVNSLLHHLRSAGSPVESLDDGTEVFTFDPEGLIDIEACAHPALRPAARLLDGSRRVTLEVPPGAPWGWTESYWAYPMGMFPDAAFPLASETLFCSEEELERQIERAVTDPAWRVSTIAGHAQVVREHCTCERFAAALLRFVASNLRTQADSQVASKVA